jgi:2-iminobutanoate/2-iminopropanoate deaminase
MAQGAAAQARQALANLQAVLQAAGSSLNRAIKVTVYMTDLAHFPEVNKAYADFFESPFPARTAIQVAALPKGGEVEIDVIALR